MATLHLSGYAIHIFVLVLALTTPVLALARHPVPAWVGFASAVGLAPMLSMLAANAWLGRPTRDFARDIPFAMGCLGLGVSVSNAAGLVMGFASRAAGEWTRTPKAAPSRAGAGLALHSWSFGARRFSHWFCLARAWRFSGGWATGRRRPPAPCMLLVLAGSVGAGAGLALGLGSWSVSPSESF